MASPPSCWMPGHASISPSTFKLIANSLKNHLVLGEHWLSTLSQVCPGLLDFRESTDYLQHRRARRLQDVAQSSHDPPALAQQVSAETVTVCETILQTQTCTSFSVSCGTMTV